MPDTKHTPGPWTIEAPMGDDQPWIVESGKQAYEWRPIATVHCDGEDIPVAESNANARLIAAAPELLEVVRDVESVMLSERGHGFEMAIRSLQSRIEAVIVKAEGRS